MYLRRHAAQCRFAERKTVRMNKLMAPMIALRVPRRAPVRRITVAQRPAGNLPATGTPMAAAVGVDITPPPGMPMGGYSIMANKGCGFRTRLKARVVYLNDGRSHAVALVQTDLPAGSLLLHHKVAEAVAGPTGLRPGDIAITASHTHSGPANFFDNDFYNKHMSSGKGLDVDFLEFVTQRVVQGILQAHRSCRPARVATGRRDIHGYNRNRSVAAYVRNENAADIRPDDPAAVFKAVNPSFYMVRVDVRDDRGDYKPLAAFSSFSVHACALAPPVEVYNADLFAYAQKDLEWAIQRKYDTPWAVVHALTAGTQGDMAPALPQQGDNRFRHFPVDWKEARKVGEGIGREAIDLFEALGDELTANVVLESAVRELDIRKHNVVEGVRLSRNAAVGNSLVAGAYERRAPWFAAVPFLRGGHWMSRRWWLFKNGPQGNKRHFGFSFLQPLVEPKSSFPSTVMFQLIRVNDAVILPLPFEVTAESGRRMAARVSQEFVRAGDDSIRHVWVAGNANGYFGYTTTPEEYSRQEYEGGHTLYGRYCTPYLTAQLGLLARDLRAKGQLQEVDAQWDYLLKVSVFYPQVRPSTGERRALAGPAIVRARAKNEEGYVRFRWQDVGPSEINFHQPLTRVEVKVGDLWVPMSVDARPVDDDGYDLEVRYISTLAGGMAEYEMRWYNPVPGGEYRLVINSRGRHSALASPAFVCHGA